MDSRRWPWALAGLVAGSVGLASSYVAATALGVRESPVVAVAEMIIRGTPGDVAEQAIDVLGFWDKPFLVGGILLFLAVMFVIAGRLSRRRWWAALLLFVALTVLGAVAVTLSPGTTYSRYLPLAVGLVTWVVVLSILTAPLRQSAEIAVSPGTRGNPNLQEQANPRMFTIAPEGSREEARSGSSRRSFLVRTGVAAGLAVVGTGLGRVVGSGRRKVEETRRLLRLSGVSEPRVPREARIGVEGVSPWQTPADDFYLIHTAIAIPTIAPRNWSLRIHGMVDRELTLTYADLIDRERTEAWITLNCVSNEVGGSLVGNAWWSGVRLADLLAEVGVSPGADAVLQTSEDGWTCGTPLAALTDDRNAMLAVAMNGQPLPLEHGFPVRTIVPGLYGYVSATKWLVDMEVTRFEDFEAYWTPKGWSEQGPVKLASRIDVPDSGDELPVGDAVLAGVAWYQQTGIAGVEVSLDGGEWLPAEIAPGPTDDTWVQWALTTEVEAGDHEARVRAIGKNGEVQTGVERDVRPDGSTGWHTIEFSAS